MSREIDCHNYRPVVGLGVKAIAGAREGVLVRPTQTTEQERQIKFIPQGNISVPTVDIFEKLQISDVSHETHDYIHYLTVSKGCDRIPVGGFKEEDWVRSKEIAHFHVNVPAYVDDETRDILARRILELDPSERGEELDYLVRMLPRVDIFSGKGLSVQIAGAPVLSLIPAPKIYWDTLEENDVQPEYNFFEGQLGQELMPYDSHFLFQYVVENIDDPVRDAQGNLKKALLIAGVRFPKAIDFNYIDAYLKTYREHAEFSNDLIRSLVDPFFHIVLNDIEDTNTGDQGYGGEPVFPRSPLIPA